MVSVDVSSLFEKTVLPSEKTELSPIFVCFCPAAGISTGLAIRAAHGKRWDSTLTPLRYVRGSGSLCFGRWKASEKAAVPAVF
jgi:hypothetical protein